MREGHCPSAYRDTGVLQALQVPRGVHVPQQNLGIATAQFLRNPAILAPTPYKTRQKHMIPQGKPGPSKPCQLLVKEMRTGVHHAKQIPPAVNHEPFVQEQNIQRFALWCIGVWSESPLA
jgi:hypothetical protein